MHTVYYCTIFIIRRKNTDTSLNYAVNSGVETFLIFAHTPFVCASYSALPRGSKNVHILKGQCHEIFNFRFFRESVPPPPFNHNPTIPNIFKKLRYNLITGCVNYTRCEQEAKFRRRFLSNYVWTLLSSCLHGKIDYNTGSKYTVNQILIWWLAATYGQFFSNGYDIQHQICRRNLEQ